MDKCGKLHFCCFIWLTQYKIEQALFFSQELLLEDPFLHLKEIYQNMNTLEKQEYVAKKWHVKDQLQTKSSHQKTCLYLYPCSGK